MFRRAQIRLEDLEAGDKAMHTLGRYFPGSEISYNFRGTAARLLVDGENVCTITTTCGMCFAVWKRSRHYEDVKDKLEGILYAMDVEYAAREIFGCGTTEHLLVECHGKKRERVEAGAGAPG